jgi:hypothetical protein
MSHSNRCLAIVIALGLCVAAQAQVSSINSVVIASRVFNDVPGATLTTAVGVNGNPWLSFTESGVSQPTGFANRDVFRFSNDGVTPYQFHGNDYFNASFNVTLRGGTPGLGLEAGFLFSNPSGTWGGDSQLIVTRGGVVAQFGGPSYYPFSPAAGGYPGAGGSVPNYTLGATYNLGMIYTVDPNTGRNAFEYYVNGQYAASSPGNRYFDLGPGQSIGSPGDFLGGYFQIQNAPGNPGNTGTAIFSDITINPVPEPATLTLFGLALLPLLLRRRA